MKIYFWILATLIFLILQSCKDKSTNPESNTIPGNDTTTNFIVSGKIICNKHPLSNADVSLNNLADLKTKSDSDGSFIIQNVSKGGYILRIEKHNSDSSFIIKSSNISVNKNTFIDSIIVPRQVNLSEPVSLNETSVKLSWTSTDAIDFREYNLYRHTSFDINENTGTLIYTSGSISDTEFTDNNLDFPVCFYRIYTTNDSCTFNGSNIVSFSSFSFPLEIGNKFYYKVNSEGYGGFYGQTKEIVDTLAGRVKEISVKNLYPDHIYEETEYWLFEDNRLYHGGYPVNVTDTIFDGNILVDTCWNSSFSTDCISNFYDNIFNQHAYCQFHYHSFHIPTGYFFKDSTYIANNIGVYLESEISLFGIIRRSLIGYIDKGVLIGDTVLSNTNRP